MYIYLKSEPGLWTVGHYNPDGKFISESDHDSPAEAAARVAYLNGDDGDAIEALAEFVAQANKLAGFPAAYDPYLGPLVKARAVLRAAGRLVEPGPFVKRRCGCGGLCDRDDDCPMPKLQRRP